MTAREVVKAEALKVDELAAVDEKSARLLRIGLPNRVRLDDDSPPLGSPITS